MLVVNVYFNTSRDANELMFLFVEVFKIKGMDIPVLYLDSANSSAIPRAVDVERETCYAAFLRGQMGFPYHVYIKVLDRSSRQHS
jgi:hypothetical protein